MSGLDWIPFILWLGYFPIPFFWLLVHPLAGFWRRVRGRVYAACAALVWLSLAGLFVATREFWFAARFPRSWYIILLALALLAVEPIIISKVETEVSLAILTGWAERDPQQFPPRLVDTGIYRRMRHPRYLSAMCALVGTALLCGATRLVAAALLSVPLYYLVTVAEELELADRLGEPFREYQRRVPRFIPRI